MSRRKQANPKPIKDATENKIDTDAAPATTTQDLGISAQINNKRKLEKNDECKNNEINENETNELNQKKFKKNDDIDENTIETSSSLESSSRVYNQNDNNNEIDVEACSDHDEEDNESNVNNNSVDSNSYINDDDDDSETVNSPSSSKENNINNSTSWSFNKSPSPSSISATSSSAAIQPKSTQVGNLAMNATLKMDEDPLKNKQNQLNNNKETSEVKKPLYTNGKVNQQRSAPIVMNGKKYYPLLFNCSDCGVRYSDKGALLTHQQNYCSKRTSKEAKLLSNDSSDFKNDEAISDNNTKTNDSEMSHENGKNTEFESICMKVEDNYERNREAINTGSTNEMKIVFNDEHNDMLNLVKTEIYQCSYCTFTTDKKCTINKHSRVHLAQKRKAMEELNSSSKDLKDTNENKNIDTSSSSNSYCPKKLFIKVKDKKSNDFDNQGEQVAKMPTSRTSSLNQTYCNECEIQFSSMKTFMHHKTHYCQKYKTIEAVLPQTVLSPSSNNAKSTKFDIKSNTSSGDTSSEETYNDKNNDEKMDNLKGKSPLSTEKNTPTLNDEQKNHNNSALHNFQHKSQSPCIGVAKQRIENNFEVSMTPNKLMSTLNVPKNYPLVRQANSSVNRAPINSGEVVYVPVYIANNNVNSHQINHLAQQPSIGSYQAPLSNDAVQLRRIIPVEFINSSNPIINRPLNASSIMSNVSQTSNLPLDLRLNSNVSKTSSTENQIISLSTNNSPLDLSCKPKEIVTKRQLDVKNAVNCEVENKEILPAYKLNECSNKQKVLFNNSNNEFVFNKYLSSNAEHTTIQKNDVSTHETFICKICSKIFNSFKVYKLHNCELKSNDDVKVYFHCKLCLNQPTFKNQDDYIHHLNNVHQNETVVVKQSVSKSPGPSISPSTLSVSGASTCLRKIYICKTCGYRGNTIRGVKQHGKLHFSQTEPFDILEAGLDEFDKITIFKNLKETDDKGSKCLRLSECNESADDTFKIGVKQSNNECKIEMKHNLSNEEKKRQHMNDDGGVSQMNENDESNDEFIYQKYCKTCKIQFQQEHSFNAHKKYYCKETTNA